MKPSAVLSDKRTIVRELIARSFVATIPTMAISTWADFRTSWSRNSAYASMSARREICRSAFASGFFRRRSPCDRPAHQQPGLTICQLESSFRSSWAQRSTFGVGASLLESSNFQRRIQAGGVASPDHDHWTARILRAHTRLSMRSIMSAQDARGPMRMTWRTLSSVRGVISLDPSLRSEFVDFSRLMSCCRERGSALPAIRINSQALGMTMRLEPVVSRSCRAEPRWCSLAGPWHSLTNAEQ